MQGVRLRSIMRLVLHCHSAAHGALLAPDKSPLRVSHKSPALPTVPLISQKERKNTWKAQRQKESSTKHMKKGAVHGQRWGWKCDYKDETGEGDVEKKGNAKNDSVKEKKGKKSRRRKREMDLQSTCLAHVAWSFSTQKIWASQRFECDAKQKPIRTTQGHLTLLLVWSDQHFLFVCFFVFCFGTEIWICLFTQLNDFTCFIFKNVD